MKNLEALNQPSGEIHHAYDVHYLDMTEAWHEHALTTAYNGIYTENFPADDRVPKERWVQSVGDGRRVLKEHIVMMVAGLNLPAMVNGVVKGLCVGAFYKEIQSALLCYSVVAEELRSNGLGKKFVDGRVKRFFELAAKSGQELKNIFVEANAPETVKPENDVMNPLERVQKYLRGGARIMDVDYCAGARNYKIMCYPALTGHEPSYTEFMGFLDTQYKGDRTSECYQKNMRSAVAKSFETAVAGQPQGPLIGSPKLLGLDDYKPKLAA